MVNLVSKWHKSIDEIPEEKWDNLLVLAGQKIVPFFKWSWLNALEDSESINNNQGWQPLHLSLWREEDLISIAPLYLKAHSYGEFIFDNGFAQLAQQLQLQYYPKLIGMSPLSPVEGYQFFTSPQEDKAKITQIMMELIDNFAIKNGILSCNFLYVDPLWRELAEAAKCSAWLNKKSLWLAQGKKNFADYLNSFNSNQRRNIKRERKAVKDSGINISVIQGDEIDKTFTSKMYTFYKEHCELWGPWGSKYLSKKFFDNLATSNIKNNLVLFIAYKQDPTNPIAMSMCITDGERLWGRYWGSKDKIKCLHFEVCYYSPINWALNNGISSFDPGAGGPHKQRRGFASQPNVSMHRWYHPTMNNLIQNWLPQANNLMLAEIKASNNEMPFKMETPPLRFIE